MGKGDGLLRLGQKQLRGGFLLVASTEGVGLWEALTEPWDWRGIAKDDFRCPGESCAQNSCYPYHQLGLYHQPPTQSSPLPVMNRMSAFPQSHMLKS